MIRKGFLAVTGILVSTIGLVIVSSASLYAAPGGIGGAVAADQCAAKGKILTFEPWYKGLTDADCNIKSPGAVGGIQKFIWIIVLNIVNDIFQAVGYVATGFIMYGGFLFMTSAGNPDQASRGRKTLINAIVGLVIAISAGVIINLIAGALVP